MGNRVRLLACFLFVFSVLLAQQEPLNVMYMHNGMMVNPAYTATSKLMSASTFHRRQWVGMRGAPVTSNMMVQFPVEKKEIGLGFSMVTDRIGPISDFYTNLYYAYHLDVDQEFRISLGINFGFYKYAAANDGLRPDELDSYDPVLYDYSKSGPCGGTGALLYADDYYFGISFPKVFQSNMKGLSPDGSSLSLHFYLAGGYVHHLNDNIVIKPSFLTRVISGSPIANDINLECFFMKDFGVGLKYGVGTNFAFMSSFRYKEKWTIAYAYDLSTSDLVYYNKGGHEILLKYDLNINKRRRMKYRYY